MDAILRLPGIRRPTGKANRYKCAAPLPSSIVSGKSSGKSWFDNSPSLLYGSHKNFREISPAQVKAGVICDAFSHHGAVAEHGLSFFLEAGAGNFLLDMGQGKGMVNNVLVLGPDQRTVLGIACICTRDETVLARDRLISGRS